ncbi:FtsX-like permease family protein [Actinoplanes rectilineatus]|uniref:FtsX-like permease family protein n=1 Tax=Actinoplanes rectilineatus TaxID=113571 RepID=UPI0005F2B7BC|nr:FtsX-like permease family protein [Actinoplanes rectilineatus]
MKAVLRRVRAYAGQLGLLAALVGLAAFLASGPARLINDQIDLGLRGDVGELGSSARDVTFSHNLEPPLIARAGDGAPLLATIRDGLRAPLPEMIDGAWFIAEVGPAAVVRGGRNESCPQLAAARRQTGADEATRIVDGRRPASRAGRSEAIIGADAAAALNLRTGEKFALADRFGVAEITVVGVFEPVDAAAPIWDDMRLVRAACPDPRDGTRWRAVLLTDAVGADTAGTDAEALEHRWRYRIDERTLTADRIGEVNEALAAARRTPPADGTSMLTSLDSTLAAFDQRLRAARSLIAVVQAGILATLAGLILLAARLAVERRRGEYALLRARGGSVPLIGRRGLAEALVVVLPAAALGWTAGILTPGRAEPIEIPLVAGVLLLGLLAPAGYAAALARRPDFTGHRGDLITARPSPRQLTAEASVVALAAGGVYLVRLRGLDAGAGVDPYLIAVPVLLALAVSLIALRIMPFPLRWAGRIAARTRGAVAFLGLSGAGRGSPLRSGPLAVLVIAVATGIFTSTVTSTVDTARSRAAELAVPADAIVDGYFFAPDTAATIAALPGVTAAAPMLTASAANVRVTGRPTILQAQVMVVDTAAFATVSSAALPAAVTAARPGGDAVPAIVSSHLAGQAAAGGTVEVQGRRYPFTTAVVSDLVPGLGTGVRDFIVLPQQAMAVPDFQPIVPNHILVKGDGFDPQAVRAAADQGQIAQMRQLVARTIEPWELTVPATVLTRDAARSALAERGVDGVLSVTFTAGLIAAAGLALLAVALTVLAGAPARGRTLSRLRTMGLSAGQGRRLLVFELVPVLAAAVLAGGVVGVALPALIGTALGLADFTAGVPTGVSVDPSTAAGVLGVAALAVIAALLVENVANRRLRLGTVLRLGEEQL